MRTYVVYEPSLEPNPNGYPLVIGLHGTGSNGSVFIATAGLVQKANDEKFIVACPDALLHGVYTYFNAGGGFEELTNGTDDLGFISAVIDTMILNYNVDTSRIYVMGFSNGSAMSYRVAAELSHKFAAIGAVSGQMVYEYCNPELPVPIIHFHGLSDPLSPYEGNDNNIPSVESVMAIWREINGCDPTPEIIYDQDGILGKRWPSSSGVSDVVLYTIEEMEHEWPRPAPLLISATDVIWDFLEVHTRPRQTYTYYSAHVTDQSPWINKIVAYNNGDQDATFRIIVWDADGQVALQQVYTAPANSSLVLVMSNFAGYVFEPDEVELVPVEGTLVIETESPKIRPKLSFRYGDSESLTEFFLQDTLAWEYILPNTIQGHFSWTGIALMNPYDNPLTVMLKAYQNGELQGQNEEDVPANTKYVRLSDGIWPGLLYMDFDQVKITSTDQAFPPPMSITGNDAQDRHVFFNGAVTAPTNLYATDSILGDLYFVPAGTFTQGSPTDEPCRDDDETQFTHNITRNLAVMETEVTRQMWADLKAVQSSLPDDPTDTDFGSGMANPVQNLTWYEAVLFANLLSVQQGFTQCYYTNETMTTPIDASNFDNNNTIYCHFTADGYRLPTEGEWEYFCRAGTTGASWVDEPNYDSSNCSACISGLLPNLEDAAVFCANDNGRSEPVGSKKSNPWGLRDVHGNVFEWCWDWRSVYPTGSATDYYGPSNGLYRILRGGCWNYVASFCRSAHRYDIWPLTRLKYFGFRLVRSLPEE